jgi:ABC-type Fe3+ transport system permease subunit
LTSYEVWLNGSAPADMEKLLRDKGLVVTGERRLADARVTAERRAPALASRIAAAGAGLACLACALGMALVGGLERRRQGELIEALAAQGLRRRPRRRLTWLGYGIVGALSLILGPVLAAVMFVLLEPGQRLSVPLKLIPQAPSPLIMGVTWLAAAVAVMCAPVALAVRERMKR